MAGTDPQRQLLTLIRDFATEKSHGERRVICLKKRIEELRSELEVANVELEEAKRLKEITEQELKGYEVELSLNDASIQTLETRISLIQDEISSVGSEVEALKNEDAALRDAFICQMVEVNAKIRKFQEKVAGQFHKENDIETEAEAEHGLVDKVVTQVDSRSLEDTLASVLFQTTKEEQEYLEEQNIQKKVQEGYANVQRKVSLIEMIMKETKALQDLTRQTSELEQTCASLGEELQKRCVCPGCHTDNVNTLSEILQTNKAN